MVEAIKSAVVLITLTGMVLFVGWAVLSADFSFDVPSVLSVRVWRRGAAPTPQVLGERDVLGARPVAVVPQYPAVRLQPAQSVFAP